MIDFDIINLIPRFILSDHTGYAMAKAIETGLKIFCAECEKAIRRVNDPTTMDPEYLNEYAWDKGVLWYDSTADVESRREQVIRAEEVYRMLGTSSGVLNAVQRIFGEGYIEEWNQYGGDLYHYKVYVTDDSALYTRNSNFMRLLSYVPNVRSVLDSVEVRGVTRSAPVREATRIYSGYYTMSATAR